ncbi:MAG: hypothetical protein A3B67_15575 [Burkholderiales bacterium RIFCSPHIGHO2_02_FULL_66_10]|nr:MAG: hypothetical protein A3B67_15575 [Burkholderiales bacterium RIFCSPHIGHO2_02_FULL_66_10]
MRPALFVQLPWRFQPPKPWREIHHPRHDACGSAKALLCKLGCLTQHLLELMPVDQHATVGMLPALQALNPRAEVLYFTSKAMDRDLEPESINEAGAVPSRNSELPCF